VRSNQEKNETRFSIYAAVDGLRLAACTPAVTGPTIDGTYKADVASAKFSTEPDVFTLKDGEYDCTSCTPPYKLPAEGKTVTNVLKSKRSGFAPAGAHATSSAWVAVNDGASWPTRPSRPRSA
jgi:hypothetical protein